MDINELFQQKDQQDWLKSVLEEADKRKPKFNVKLS